MRELLAYPPLIADAGVPMIFLTLPAMVMLLIPVIVVEGYLCKKWLELTTWQAMKSNAVSNLASTIIGIPFAWAVMYLVEVGFIEVMGSNSRIQNWHSPLASVIMFFVSAAWIGALGPKSLWLVPAATLILLVPFFFASYGIEYLVIKQMVGVPEGGPPNLTYPRVRVAVRNANLITYGAMFLATSVWLILTLPRH